VRITREIELQRLNVRQSQIRECIEKSLFAVDVQPRFPTGEILLLQLVKQEAIPTGKLHSRIEFALVYEHYEIDHTGEISRLHWPVAGKTWKYILFCSNTIATVPFSLEDLSLSTEYGGQTNPRQISPEDEVLIQPYLWGQLSGYRLRDEFGPSRIRETIANYDVVAQRQAPRKIVVPAHEDFYRDPVLAESLKATYDHRCQACGMDFRVKYDQPFAETHHVQALSAGGLDVGKNILVVCPNHHRIIHKTTPIFDRRRLLYKYPNGLEERLILCEHLEKTSFWE
jgi:hypothetical protein